MDSFGRSWDTETAAAGFVPSSCQACPSIYGQGDQSFECWLSVTCQQQADMQAHCIEVYSEEFGFECSDGFTEHLGCRKMPDKSDWSWMSSQAHPTRLHSLELAASNCFVSRNGPEPPPACSAVPDADPKWTPDVWEWDPWRIQSRADRHRASAPALEPNSSSLSGSSVVEVSSLSYSLNSAVLGLSIGLF